MSRTAVFHCRAAPAIGSGHMMRCLTLADALSRRGWRVGFAADAESRRTAPAIEAAGVTVREADTVADLARAWPDGADLTVIDRYDRDARFERALRPWAGLVLAIDDLADRPHDADILLDSAAEPGSYDGLTGPDCVRLLGPDYALLRPEFRRLREACAGRPAAIPQNSRARDQGPGKCPHLVISVGGTDPDNATGAILDWIEGCRTPLRVTVVLGANAPHADAVARRAQRSAHAVLVKRQVADMAGLLAEADLAIGAGGNTAWERCCLGAPTLIVVIADNQRRIAERLIESGAALALIPETGAAPSLPASVLEDLFEGERARLDAMSAAAAALCDGNGAERTAVGIGQVLGDLPGGLCLRPCRAGDEAVLLAWQRAPATRRHFRNPDPPSPEEHRRWFATKLADPACLLSMVEDAQGAAALVRLDLGTAKCAEVSILVAPDRRGKGVGGAALALIRALRPELRLTAEVLPGNTASHALFRRSGYRLDRPGLYVSPPATPSGF